MTVEGWNWKIDKSAFSVVSLNEEHNDREYWLSKTPEERFEAIEMMRQINYGYDPTTERLQRVLEVVELKPDKQAEGGRSSGEHWSPLINANENDASVNIKNHISADERGSVFHFIVRSGAGREATSPASLSLADEEKGMSRSSRHPS